MQCILCVWVFYLLVGMPTTYMAGNWGGLLCLVILFLPLGTCLLKKKIQTVGSSALLKPQSLGLASQGEHIFLVEDHPIGVNVAVLLSHLLSTYYLLGSTCYAIVQNRWCQWGVNTPLTSGQHSCVSHVYIPQLNWGRGWTAGHLLPRKSDF